MLSPDVRRRSPALPWLAAAAAALAVFPAAASVVEFATYHGGCRGYQGIQDLAVDAAGDVWVAGYRPWDCDQGPLEVHLARYTAAGERVAIVEFGGHLDDEAKAVAIDAAGNLWVAGTTRSSRCCRAFPTVDPLQADNAGGADAFLTQLDPSGTTILYSTFLGGNSFSPSLDGGRIAFDSSADPLGTNPDGNGEIFLYEIATNVLTQVTDTVGPGSEFPSLDGGRIAFSSGADPLGTNPENNPEIFLYEIATDALTQVTQTSGGASRSASLDGDRIAFHSTADPLGTNPDGNQEIFVHDLGTALLLQVTVTEGALSELPSLDGDRVAFASTADPFGTNPDGNLEIFVYDLATATLSQVTQSSSGHSQRPSLEGDRIAFDSSADHLATNPDGNSEIFVADCVTVAPSVLEVPALGAWGLAALAVLLAGSGLLLSRRWRHAGTGGTNF